MITYEIPGKPIPLQRPRMCGKFVYDPQKKEKKEYREKIEKLRDAIFPCSTPMKLIVEYHMPIPKSYSQKRSLECEKQPHVKKPDLSNLIKFTEDALNGLLWKDDAYISEIAAKKIYSKEPKTVFKIETNIVL